ncbi:MAG: MarR family transcriptional regulator [Pseudomonadota bacterium]
MTEHPDVNARINTLLDRLSRIIASDGWDGDLNPAQTAALSYLARANRFSRSPSIVAEYLGATRGTVSQTLKALHRKGLIEESPNPTDKRSISYAVTQPGEDLVRRRGQLDGVLDTLPEPDRTALEVRLRQVVKAALTQREMKPFGECKTCRHHLANGDTLHCSLLDLPLGPEEADQICFEQTHR